jgi:hypothetical protein
MDASKIYSFISAPGKSFCISLKWAFFTPSNFKLKRKNVLCVTERSGNAFLCLAPSYVKESLLTEVPNKEHGSHDYYHHSTPLR